MQWTKPNAAGTKPSPVQKHTASLVGRKIFFIGGSYTRQDPIKGGEVEEFNNTLVFDTGWFIPSASVSISEKGG